MIKTKLYDLIVEILQEKPICRDNDYYLMYVVYDQMWPLINANKSWQEASKEDMFGAIHDNKLPTMSSIGRARRLAQQNFPDLRGDKYKARQNKATKKMKGFIATQTYTDTYTKERTYHDQKLS